MLNNLKLRYKLLLFPALFVLAILVVSLTFFRGSSRSKDLLEVINHGYVPYQERAILMKAELNDLQRSLQDAVSAADESMLENSTAIFDSISSSLQSLKNNLVGQDNEDVLSMSQQISSYYQLAHRVTSEMIAGNFSEALGADIETMVGSYNNISELLDNILMDSKQKVSDAFVMAEESSLNSGKVILGVLLVSLLVVIAFSLLIASKLNGPIAYMKVSLNRLAEGNLRLETNTELVNRRDEIGEMARSLDQLTTKLGAIITEVQQGINTFSNASNETFKMSASISSSANQQASSLEEVSSTMEQITANIEQNTENAMQSEKVSMEANTSINRVSEQSEKTMEANKEIASKISIINDIASQTNILALNAAVEAARAGEHGKGFAVVAAEVRKLAENSKVAADQIVELAMIGLSLSEEAGKIMDDTMPKIENTSRLTAEISAASIEQNNGAAQVSNAINQLNDVTQQNASMSEELTSSAQELASQAEHLREVVAFFS